MLEGRVTGPPFYWGINMRITALVLASILLAGCSNWQPAAPQEEEEPVSFLTGKPGGIKLSDLGDLNKNIKCYSYASRKERHNDCGQPEGVKENSVYWDVI